tara:strand:- start:24 stop:305 length:282 start_codon:yes stop_codon:yes gene_type:complete
VRLDLFLKQSRIIKQREAAKKACDRGMVSIAGRAAKPGQQIMAKDIISVKWAYRRLEFEVLYLPRGNVSKEKAQELYHVLLDEQLDDDPFGSE